MDKKEKKRLVNIVLFIFTIYLFLIAAIGVIATVAMVIKRIDNTHETRIQQTETEEEIASFGRKIKFIKYKLEPVEVIKDKILLLNPKADTTNIYKLAYQIFVYSERTGFDKDLLISIAYEESRFYKYAVSSANCMGYFQINPIHVKKSNMSKIYEEEFQVRMACVILGWKLHHFGNDMITAINAYNGDKSISNEYCTRVINHMSKIQS